MRRRPGVREQLAALAKLSQIDESAREFDAELTELPARIDEMRTDVRRLEDLLAKERERQQEAESLHKAQKAEVAERTDALSKAKSKAAKARTPKEADASEREVETNRRAIRDREEEVEKLAGAVEKLRGQVQEHEKELAELQDVVAKEESEAKARLAELEAERDRAVAGRDEVAAKLPKNVFQRYERVRKHKGSGVSLVTTPNCGACSMAIPPQMFNELQRGDSLHQCQNCLRILVFKPLVED